MFIMFNSSFWTRKFIFRQKKSTKNWVLLWFCWNSDLHTFLKILKKWKKNLLKKMQTKFFNKIFSTISFFMNFFFRIIWNIRKKIFHQNWSKAKFLLWFSWQFFGETKNVFEKKNPRKTEIVKNTIFFPKLR